MSLAKPTTKEELFQLVKTKLGDPVIKIPVADEQMDVRLQEALDLFERFHFDAIERQFMAVRITADDVTNRYIQMPEGVSDVIRVLAFDGRYSQANTGLLWFAGGMTAPFNNWIGMGGSGAGFGSLEVGIGPYGISDAVTMFLGDQQIAHFDNIMFPEDVINYNSLTRRLRVNVRANKLVADSYLVAEADVSIARVTDDFGYVLKCSWLKRYFTALVGYQFGINISKYRGGSLFGGDVQLNSDEILGRYTKEKEDLERELEEKWTAPAGFFIG